MVNNNYTPDSGIEPLYSELLSNDDYIYDIQNIAKQNPKTTGARDYWSRYLRDFSLTILPMVVGKAITNGEHPRNAAVVGIDPSHDEQISGTLSSWGLNVEETNQTISDSDFNRLASYPNTPILGDPESLHSSIYDVPVYIIHNNYVDDDFKEQLKDDSENSLRNVADAFGIPDCCTDALVERISKNIGDGIYHAACHTSTTTENGTRTNVSISSGNPLLNTMWRYHGWSFLQYTPCSFTCDNAGEMAKLNYETIHDIDGEIADALLAWLDMNTSWSAYHGLTNIKNSYFIGSYTTDEHWTKKTTVWGTKHMERPEMNRQYQTSKFEKIEPEMPSLEEF